MVIVEMLPLFKRNIIVLLVIKIMADDCYFSLNSSLILFIIVLLPQPVPPAIPITITLSIMITSPDSVLSTVLYLCLLQGQMLRG